VSVKNINKPDDIRRVKAQDIRPGMLLAEGVVLEVEDQQAGSGRKLRTIYWLRTPSASVWAAWDQEVDVFAVITDDLMVEAIVRTYGPGGRQAV